MKAIDRHFTKLINGTTQFVIPVFQRDYSWTDSHCEALWNDIIRVGSDPQSAGHFVGSVVYVPSGDTAAGFTRWLLIDGQQRLTTVTLLLLALRDHLTESGWQPKSEDDPTQRRIDAYFLRNTQEEGDRQQKLVLRRHDQQVLKALLDVATPPSDIDSQILENYAFFREKAATVDPSVVYRGIGKLIVVDVALDRGSDDPQLIFESLNSTGLDLSQADLIRNFILMRVDEKSQTRLYESYWRHIEEMFRGSPKIFDNFARDYMALIAKTNKQVRADQIYHEFRAFFRLREATTSADAELAEMLRFAKYYAAFAGTSAAPKALATSLQRLNRLAEVAAVAVMRLFDCHSNKKTLSDSEMIQALELLESFVIRRSVCGLQTRAYGQFFPSVAQCISDDAPLSTLQVALAGTGESHRFPADQEFQAELEHRDLYSMRNCHFILDRIENFDTKELSETSEYTIEHVLPQNERLGKAWRDMLGEDWKEIQRMWVHRLGNLTLTGYNSTYSDKPFEEKKTIKGGFNVSAVRLNQAVREASVWTAGEIEARGKMLSALALKIWPAPKASKEALGRWRRTELEREAAKRSVGELPMFDRVRPLFEEFRKMILSIDPRIIEVPRANSVSYYADDGDFFVEVLPRRWKLVLLLNLPLSECGYRDDNLSDSAEYKFIVNAEHEGGSVYRLREVENFEGALKLVRQSYEVAAQ
jgi:predicted transport protein